MRQSVQISKLNGFRSGFMAFLVAASFGFSASSIAAGPATKPAKPDAAIGEKLYTNGDPQRGVIGCASCHGAEGKSAAGAWPKLAGQHSAYTIKQLKNYKDGTRANAIMAGMSAALTEQDMANIAAYLSKQTVSLGVAQNKETIGLGKQIYAGGIAEKGIPACAACHSPNGAGIPAQYPLLSGQWADYSMAQLGYFRDGTRKNNAAMTAIAAKLSDVEMKAVSDYMAGLR
ncbi:c-type cytochrome [Polynucleobacter difficilis]|jgi:cytochrome c553|uniref:c-type cytochrome n=1 Tax=Polynucleobacter difficilis TaxID=556054 RepID=UPI000D38DAD2|nr:c-type cytochrome [Polynucleobacter difficilis]